VMRGGAPTFERGTLKLKVLNDKPLIVLRENFCAPSLVSPSLFLLPFP